MPILESPATVRDPLLTVSNGMVRLYKEALGRGPRRAWTSYAGPDALVVLLERTLTTEEQSLAALGEYVRMHEARLVIQSALEPRARAVVEDELRRRTVAYATGLDAQRDVATMFFTLGVRLDGRARPGQIPAHRLTGAPG